jgi:hypothetical protein
MHPLQRDLFRRFALSLIVILTLFSASCCISSLIVSNVYAAQSDEGAAIAGEETALPQAAQTDGEAVADTAKDSKTKDTKTTESTSISTMSAGSQTGSGDNTYGSLAAVTDISQSSGSASAKIPIEVPPGRLGIAPQLSLTYNSYRGSGWIGMGWNIDMGAIQRSTKYGVNYNGNAFVEINSGNSSELVPWGTNCYRVKIEGSHKILL